VLDAALALLRERKTALPEGLQDGELGFGQGLGDTAGTGGIRAARDRVGSGLETLLFTEWVTRRRAENRGLANQ
jgi:hypothetical protein